jgi:hypothetical protein
MAIVDVPYTYGLKAMEMGDEQGVRVEEPLH